jgi:hypothetical protein
MAKAPTAKERGCTQRCDDLFGSRLLCCCARPTFSQGPLEGGCRRNRASVPALVWDAGVDGKLCARLERQSPA